MRKNMVWNLVSMIAPNPHERIRSIAARGQGLCLLRPLWASPECSITTDIGAMVKLVKETKAIPRRCRLRHLHSEQAREMAQKADGVIVGSAIVKLIAANGRDSVEPVWNM